MAHIDADQEDPTAAAASPDSDGETQQAKKQNPDFLGNAKEAKGAAMELEKASGFVAERVRSRAKGMREDWEGHQMEGLRMNFNPEKYMNAHSLEAALIALTVLSPAVLGKMMNAGFRLIRSSEKDFGDALMVLDIYLSIATQSVPGVSLASAERARTEISTVVGKMAKQSAFLGTLGLIYPPLLGFEAVAGALQGTHMLIEDPLNHAIRRVRQEMNAEEDSKAVESELKDAHLKASESTPPGVVTENKSSANNQTFEKAA